MNNDDVTALRASLRRLWMMALISGGASLLSLLIATIALLDARVALRPASNVLQRDQSSLTTLKADIVDAGTLYADRVVVRHFKDRPLVSIGAHDGEGEIRLYDGEGRMVSSLSDDLAIYQALPSNLQYDQAHRFAAVTLGASRREAHGKGYLTLYDLLAFEPDGTPKPADRRAVSVSVDGTREFVYRND